MPHAGLEPATSTYATQNIAQLTKSAGDTKNEITHPHSCAKMTPAGIEPETSAYAAHAITHLTKYAEKRQNDAKIPDACKKESKTYGSPTQPRN